VSGRVREASSPTAVLSHGVGLNCGVGVGLEMAGRVSRRGVYRLTQGSLASWGLKKPPTGEPLSLSVKRDRAAHGTSGSENHVGSSSSRTFIRRTLVCGLWRLGPLPSSLIWSAAQTPVLAAYCGNNRRQHGDGRDRQSQFSDGLVSSPFQPLPCFVASDGPPASGDVGRESLDEAEPLQQLSKLDVVVWNSAEHENQLEPALNGLLRHRERSSCRGRSGDWP
jgi:hypothetical protein